MSTLRLSLCALAVLATATAWAGVTPIDEFPGTMFEGFENLAPLGGYPAPYTIMGGQATIDDVYAHSLIIANSLYSFPSDTYIFPYNGNLMGGTPTGWNSIEFAEPVQQFGGFIGTADLLTGGSAVFKDAQGTVLDTVPLVVPLGDWRWFGWQSDVPIKRIEINGSAQIGQPLVFDDLRATVPEPATLSGLAAWAAFALGRRR